MTSPANQRQHPDQSRQTLAGIVAKALEEPDINGRIGTFCAEYEFRKYEPARTEWAVAAVEDTVQAFLWDGDQENVDDQLSASMDTSDRLHDLTRGIAGSDLFGEIVSSVTASLVSQHPKLNREQTSNRVADLVLDRFINEIDRHDPSQPSDAMRGLQLGFVYIPFHDGRKAITETRTSWWGEASDAVTIKPDQAFISFMKLANISKEAWLTALAAEGIDISDDGGLNGVEKADRRAMWSRANWSVSGEPIVSVAEVVRAVDLCSFGFTPFIAFNMDAHKLVNRKWQQAMSVSGGILGLHDFVHGSGNPIRFEGQCVLPAKIGNVMLHDRLKHNLFKVHGLTRQALKAKVKDSADKQHTVSVMENRFAADMTVPQLDLSTVAKSAGADFAEEIADIISISDATDLESDAIDDALLSAIALRADQLARQFPKSLVSEHVAAEKQRQIGLISTLPRKEKVAALVGLYGPEAASKTVRDLSGYFDGPGL
jgi:hypothetical protein